MRKILVLNLGSTSFKFKLYSFGGDEKETLLSTGEIERVGSDSGSCNFDFGGEKESGRCSCPTHGDAFAYCIQQLTGHRILVSLEDLDAVGYKAVHGGKIDGPRLVTEELLAAMESYVPFAPAHNPMYIKTMREIGLKYPKLSQVACFETVFHTTVPEYRTVYGVPHQWRELYGICRYGFHGASHEYISRRMAELSPDVKRLISVHLGGSSSLCAVEGGKSVAASMGATPQSGLFQNNRVGDFDVFCLPELIRRLGSLDVVLGALSTRSGFLGLSGVSNDLREVIEAGEGGNANARLALESFVDNIVGYIGMYTAYLGGLDAIAFTGGIGQNSGLIRAKICEKLAFMNIRLQDDQARRTADAKISASDSGAEIWMLKTNEELMVARKTLKLIGAQK